MKTETIINPYKNAKLACVIGVALLVMYGLWSIFSSPFSRAAFDEKHWADVAGRDDTCIRGAMVNDLLKKRIQLGMPKSDLIAIIGEPDRSDAADISYYLGFCQTPIDPDTLDFHFDTHGLLTSHEIKNH
jgi:hypothetical protein